MALLVVLEKKVETKKIIQYKSSQKELKISVIYMVSERYFITNLRDMTNTKIILDYHTNKRHKNTGNEEGNFLLLSILISSSGSVGNSIIQVLDWICCYKIKP